MPRCFVVIPLIAAVLALSSCGGDGGSPAASDAAIEGSTEDVEVIRDWAEALTDSDIDAAAAFFAVPSVAENGIAVEIETIGDARAFNDSLPCGAELESTSAQGEFITATFKLTERPGIPECPGSGNTAETSFVIEDGEIVEWRRVALPGEGSTAQTS